MCEELEVCTECGNKHLPGILGCRGKRFDSLGMEVIEQTQTPDIAEALGLVDLMIESLEVDMNYGNAIIARSRLKQLNKIRSTLQGGANV